MCMGQIPDPMAATQPRSPRPEWATEGVPCGGELLQSGKIPEAPTIDRIPAEAGESVQPRLLPAPAVPSKQEIAEHQTTPPRGRGVKIAGMVSLLPRSISKEVKKTAKRFQS